MNKKPMTVEELARKLMRIEPDKLVYFCVKGINYIPVVGIRDCDDEIDCDAEDDGRIILVVA